MGNDLLHLFLSSLWQMVRDNWQLWIFVCLATVLAGLIRFVPTILEKRRLRKAGISDIDAMTGLEFEKYLAIGFRAQGYDVERTPYVGDFGADHILKRDGIRVAVQAKRSKRRVGIRAVQEVVAARGHYRCDAAMVVTNSEFTEPAKRLAASNRVQMLERSELIHILAGGAREAETLPPIDTPSEADADDSVCSVCGLRVSPRVRQFCLSQPQRFSGQVYCIPHQRGGSNVGAVS